MNNIINNETRLNPMPINIDSKLTMTINVDKLPLQSTSIIHLNNRNNPDNIKILKEKKHPKSSSKYFHLYIKTQPSNPKDIYGFKDKDTALILPDKTTKKLLPLIDPYGGHSDYALFLLKKPIRLKKCSLLLSNLYPDIHAINIYIYD